MRNNSNNVMGREKSLRNYMGNTKAAKVVSRYRSLQVNQQIHAKTVRFNVVKIEKKQIFGSARKQFALF